MVQNIQRTEHLWTNIYVIKYVLFGGAMTDEVRLDPKIHHHYNNNNDTLSKPSRPTELAFIQPCGLIIPSYRFCEVYWE